MPESVLDAYAMLRELARRRVDAIVVGGMSAVLQGVARATFDLDLVHSREPENLERLVAALQELGAYYREHPAKRPAPGPEDLAGPGHHLLLTRAGPLDLLGAVTGDRGYEELLPDSIELELDEEFRIRALGLEMLIRLKEELDREEDRAVLPLLRAALREQKRGDAKRR